MNATANLSRAVLEDVFMRVDQHLRIYTKHCKLRNTREKEADYTFRIHWVGRAMGNKIFYGDGRIENHQRIPNKTG